MRNYPIGYVNYVRQLLKMKFIFCVNAQSTMIYATIFIEMFPYTIHRFSKKITLKDLSISCLIVLKQSVYIYLKLFSDAEILCILILFDSVSKWSPLCKIFYPFHYLMLCIVLFFGLFLNVIGIESYKPIMVG